MLARSPVESFTPPAMSTLLLGSNVAVALKRAVFIEEGEGAGARLPFGAGVGGGVGFCDDDDPPPPHPASARIKASVSAVAPPGQTVSNGCDFARCILPIMPPPHSLRDIAALL